MAAGSVRGRAPATHTRHPVGVGGAGGHGPDPMTDLTVVFGNWSKSGRRFWT